MCFSSLVSHVRARFWRNRWFARTRSRTCSSTNLSVVNHFATTPYANGRSFHSSSQSFHQTTGPIETTLCDYETIESVNEELYRNLHDLVQTPFFRYFQAGPFAFYAINAILTRFQVDLYRECPFWQENGFCMNRECGITTIDEVNRLFALLSYSY